MFAKYQNLFLTYTLLSAFNILIYNDLHAQNKLELSLTAFEKDPELKYASVGFSAIDVNTGAVVAERNPNQSLTPASSLKVITTSTALAILGHQYKFKTELAYEGRIMDGVLYGNILIKGYGDPTLASPIMEQAVGKDSLMRIWTKAVKDLGIQKIEGAIIGDGSYWDYNLIPPSWQWGDMGNHYGAGVSGLNFNDNGYTLVLQQNPKVGGLTKVKSHFPDLSNIEFINEVVSAARGTGDNAYLYMVPFESKVYARGTIPVGNSTFGVRGAVPDPPLFAAYSFQNQLLLQGIACSKPATTVKILGQTAVRNVQVFHTHFSPALIEIVKHTNEDSRNMYCEAMIKTIGLKQKNKADWVSGLGAMCEFWAARGVDMRGFFLYDGSGLSARNAVSTKSFAQIMRLIHMDKTTFGDFYNLLAVSGSTGTLTNVGKNSPAAGNVRAKSGTLNRVKSYTGYVTTASGRLLAFCMIANNYSCSSTMIKQKMEELMIQMALLK